MSDAARAESLAERALRLPQWASWAVTILMMFFIEVLNIDPNLPPNFAYRNVVMASCVGLAVYAATLSFLIGLRSSARARAHWFLVAFLAVGLPFFLIYVPSFIPLFLAAGVVRPDRPKLPRAYVWGAAGSLALIPVVPGLAVLVLLVFFALLAERLWFAGSRRPPQRIPGHLASPLLLAFVIWFMSAFSRGDGAIANPILILIAVFWVFWTTLAAYRLARRPDGVCVLSEGGT